MYAITLHQPGVSLIALGIKTVETRSWPAPARLVGRTIAIHAGKRVVKGPGDAIERELRTRLGEDWSRHIPTGAVLATAVLAGMARVAHIDPLTDHAGHDPNTEIGCAVGLARTPIVSMFRLIPGAFQRRPLGVVPGRYETIARGVAGRRPPVLPVLGYLRRVVVVYHLLMV